MLNEGRKTSLVMYFITCAMVSTTVAAVSANYNTAVSGDFQYFTTKRKQPFYLFIYFF